MPSLPPGNAATCHLVPPQDDLNFHLFCGLGVQQTVNALAVVRIEWTVDVHSKHSKRMKIQVILRRHPTPGAVLRGFYMSISSVCWTGTKVLATPTYAASMDTRTSVNSNIQVRAPSDPARSMDANCQETADQ
jgi:hypothetical protein